MTTAPHPSLPQVLALSDKGKTVPEIAASLNLGTSRVYTMLRMHRPDRPRSRRVCGSPRRTLVLGLLAKGYEPNRVAELAQCSRAWVYRVRQGL